MSTKQNSHPLDQLPPPALVHARLGEVYREAALLRRLLRLSQAAREDRGDKSGCRQELAQIGATS